MTAMRRHDREKLDKPGVHRLSFQFQQRPDNRRKILVILRSLRLRHFDRKPDHGGDHLAVGRHDDGIAKAEGPVIAEHLCLANLPGILPRSGHHLPEIKRNALRGHVGQQSDRRRIFGQGRPQPGICLCHRATSSSTAPSGRGEP
jgi:hypothetical protein